jgi:16S rRNA (uracil1498-N3)-methyltransferase
MLRIFLPVINLSGNQVSISGEKARYLATVLRCATGDELIVFGGQGNCLRTRILRVDRREVLAEVLKEFVCNMESPLNIVLVQGLLKGQKMDMVIQKATELGIKEVQPVVTQRSQLRDTRKVARWKKIAEEASEQSGRSIVPIIHEPIGFNDFLLSPTFRHSPGSLRGCIFYEEGGMKISEATKELKQSLGESVLDLRTSNPSSSAFTNNPPSSPFAKGGKRMITETNAFFVVIGPEGGFTKEEITAAENKGLIVTTLGKRILRAETAALSAITLVQFLLGDLSYSLCTLLLSFRSP